MRELNYRRLESKLDRLVGELRDDMRIGFSRLEHKIEAQPITEPSGADLIFDGFGRRATRLLFIYSMACAVTNAAIIVVMLRRFGLLH